MHILLTGASGQVGSHTLIYLLRRAHKVTALDINPPPPAVEASIKRLTDDQQSNYTFIQCDLTDFRAFEDVLGKTQPEGIIHLGAVPDPKTLDFRIVHNVNVTSSYNVLQTAARRGMPRIVQASSVNATGLSYSPDGHHIFQEMPVKESHALLPVSV